MSGLVSTVMTLPIVKELTKAVSEGRAGGEVAATRALEPKGKGQATSTREERAAAASRRSRRAGRRSLLAGGRLGAGGDDGNQTTLGAG